MGELCMIRSFIEILSYLVDEMYLKWTKCLTHISFQEVEMIENIQALLQQRISESDRQLRLVDNS